MWAVISVVRGVRMNMEDSRLIAQFQRSTTELLIEKRLGRRRPELTDELYRTWLRACTHKTPSHGTPYGTGYTTMPTVNQQGNAPRQEGYPP